MRKWSRSATSTISGDRQDAKHKDAKKYNDYRKLLDEMAGRSTP